MNEPQVAIYARVSSEQQSEAKTIESQLSDLRAHVKALGLVLPSEHEFVDNGYSGSNLIRPALEQLRDVVAAGGIDQVYVHCPDRLARNYAHQVLLLEEFLHAGVEVNFLNREVGQTPEDQLLLQVQGMIAEYERAKILERSRRGKRHAAQGGSVSVLSGAPYGYRYVSKHDGDGQARFDVLLEEARVVRQVFSWVGQDRCSIGEVCRRLNAAKEQTRTGKTVWDRATVCDMLKNPAYKGTAAFGKTSVEPLRPRLRAQRGRPMQPKRAVSTHDVPPEKWMSIPVPALIDEALFEAVQDQLQENEERVICCRACLCVPVADMLIMASQSARVREKAMPAVMRIIAVSARMPTASVGCGYVGTSNCERIWWMKPSGTRSASCWKIPRDWNRNIASACLPKSVQPNGPDLRPVSDGFDKALPA
jgi:site-specific DNA recombinase